jgi:hypothetical protein
MEALKANTNKEWGAMPMVDMAKIFKALRPAHGEAIGDGGKPY